MNIIGARRAVSWGAAPALLASVALLVVLIAALVGVSSRHGIATGPVLATLTLGPGANGLALDTRAGRAIVGGDRGGHAYVVDTRTATLLRTVTIGPALSGPTANWPMVGPEPIIVVDEQDGRAFVSPPPFGPPPRGLSMIDTGSGRLLATIPYAGFSGPWFAVDARSRHLFMLDNPSRSEQVRVYDARGGRLLRVTFFDMPPFLPSGISWSGDTVPVAVDARNGRVFVSRQISNAVSMLDAPGGRLLRTTTIAPLPAGATSINVTSPIVDERDERVFVASADRGTVTTLDARDGRVLRSVRLVPYADNPVVDGVTGRVFVAASNGIAMLDARSGRLESRLSGPSGLPGWGGPPAIDGATGDVLVADNARRVVDVFDGRRGRLLRMLRAGGDVGGFTVDAPAGRVYVLSSGYFDPRKRTFTGPALLRVFGERTGRLLRAIALGVGSARRVYIDDWGATRSRIA